MENAIDDFYYEIASKLKDGRFEFEKYSMIISHKSAFEDKNTSIIEKLKNGCKQAKIPLVLFSGGIDENYYNKSDYELILMNSKVLYSKNLALFLDASNENILMLLYGKRWKLNIALNILEQINYLLQLDQKEIVMKFQKDEITIEFINSKRKKRVLIESLKNIDFDYYIEKDINKLSLQKLHDKLYKYIQESVFYE